MTELLSKAFDHELTAQEEAMLNKLEAEWLARQRGIELECFDHWTPRQRITLN